MPKFSFILLAILAGSNHMAHAGQTGSTNKYQRPALSADEQDRQNTLLLDAAKRGDEVEINLLLSQGAEVDARDELGNTPLMLATSFGHYGTMKALLAWYADANVQNDDGDTALTLLAQYGVEDDSMAEQMVGLLIQEGGANPYQGDRDFNLPVSIAIEQGNTDVAGALASLTDRMERLALDEEAMAAEPRKKKRRLNAAIACGDEGFRLGNQNNDKDDDDLRDAVRAFQCHSLTLDS